MTPPTPPPSALPEREPSHAALTIQAVLAVMVALVFAGAFGAAFVTGNLGLVHDLTEVLKALVYGVFGYYFGSSVGSRIKDARRGPPHG